MLQRNTLTIIKHTVIYRLDLYKVSEYVLKIHSLDCLL